jgi:hypothetical protein
MIINFYERSDNLKEEASIVNKIENLKKKKEEH